MRARIYITVNINSFKVWTHNVQGQGYLMLIIPVEKSEY